MQWLAWELSIYNVLAACLFPNSHFDSINKENLSWFFDLHYIFKTRGRVLRKKTSNSEDLKNMRDNYNHKYKALM